ncbi:MAG: hypothetical protein L6R28_14070 [Planctomycetes bacterium]|nr:hypothetical protein [Planctomycetota bacterium]
MKNPASFAFLAAAALLAVSANLCAEDAGGEADRAKKNFEASYTAAAKAIKEDDWATAETVLDAALKALGDNEHPNKIAAQVLHKKAVKINTERKASAAALSSAQELLRLEQWDEAEKLFQKAKELGADEASVKKGLDAAAAGKAKAAGDKPAEEPAKAAEEKPAADAGAPSIEPPVAEADAYRTAMRAGLEALGKKDWDTAIANLEKALKAKPGDKAAESSLAEARREKEKVEAAKTAAAQPAKPAEQPLPAPASLRREDWTQGTGSNTMWAANLLHLNEGDEKWKTMLTGNFRVSIAIEAQMDHRSFVCIELRPDKKDRKGDTPKRIIGWGSKEGSGPYLMVDGETAGSKPGQPAAKQIMLSFRRDGQRIVFYCNGEQVAETWKVPAEAGLWLYVTGKGIMNGAKLEKD